MAGEDIPLRLIKFISANISSVEHILVLQILQENPTRLWSTEDVAMALRSGNLSITRRMNHLYESGVLSRHEKTEEEVHSFIPASYEMAELIGLLIKAFRERPTRIIELIYSPTPSAIQAFADAFKFRK